MNSQQQQNNERKSEDKEVKHEKGSNSLNYEIKTEKHAFQFNHGKEVISKEWILLDNQNSTHIFCDKTLMTDIQEVDTALELITNGEILKTNQKGYVNGLGWVWYHPSAITNIISFALLEDIYYLRSILIFLFPAVFVPKIQFLPKKTEIWQVSREV